MKILIAILGIIFLAACNTTTSSVTGVIERPNINLVGPFPENYKQIVADYVKKRYFDPTSIIQAEINQPEARQFPDWMKLSGDQRDGWRVCWKANAKNRFGGYTGQNYHGITINNGKIVETNVYCFNKDFEPFTEIES